MEHLYSPEELLIQYNSLVRRRSRLDTDSRIFLEAAQKTCIHPEGLRVYSDSESDDGYGRFWKVKQTYCKMCGKKRLDGYGKEVWE
jgi:hypothetical protein